MDGTALFVTTASVFLAQLNQVQLTAGDCATVVLTRYAANNSHYRQISGHISSQPTAMIKLQTYPTMHYKPS